MEEQEKLNIDLDFLDKKESARVNREKTDNNIKTSTVSEGHDNIPAIRPWVRYWARYLDVVLFSIVFGIFLAIFMPSVLDSSDIFLTILILFAWVFAESAILSSWGTTPGKWLFRIKLAGPENKIEFSDALNRSFAVWLKGMGMGIPIVSLFTLLSSHNRLKSDGATSWDRDGRFTISHGKVGVIRILAAIFIFLIFIIILAASQN